jgi:hypothetical protein
VVHQHAELADAVCVMQTLHAGVRIGDRLSGHPCDDHQVMRLHRQRGKLAEPVKLCIDQYDISGTFQHHAQLLCAVAFAIATRGGQHGETECVASHGRFERHLAAHYRREVARTAHAAEHRAH